MIQDKVMIKRGKFVDFAIIEHDGEKISEVICFDDLDYQTSYVETVEDITTIVEIKPYYIKEQHKQAYFEQLLDDTRKELMQ